MSEHDWFKIRLSWLWCRRCGVLSDGNVFSVPGGVDVADPPPCRPDPTKAVDAPMFEARSYMAKVFESPAVEKPLTQGRAVEKNTVLAEPVVQHPVFEIVEDPSLPPDHMRIASVGTVEVVIKGIRRSR